MQVLRISSKRKIGLSLLAFFGILGIFELCLGLARPSVAFAQNDTCADCIQRKQLFCSDECDEVPASRTRLCQKRCILGYCSHRCSRKSPEIQALTQESCNACAERQFSLCQKHCPVGTARERAVCQVDCSLERCEPVCHGEEPVKQAEKLVVPIEPEKPKGDDEDDEDEDEEGESTPGADEQAGGEGGVTQ